MGRLGDTVRRLRGSSYIGVLPPEALRGGFLDNIEARFGSLRERTQPSGIPGVPQPGPMVQRYPFADRWAAVRQRVQTPSFMSPALVPPMSPAVSSPQNQGAGVLGLGLLASPPPQQPRPIYYTVPRELAPLPPQSEPEPEEVYRQNPYADLPASFQTIGWRGALDPQRVRRMQGVDEVTLGQEQAAHRALSRMTAARPSQSAEELGSRRLSQTPRRYRGNYSYVGFDNNGGY